MSAIPIDGKAYAVRLRSGIAGAVAALKAGHGFAPGLAVILAGSDPASQVYVRNKDRAVKEVGMASFPYYLPADAAEADLLALVQRLNEDMRVHGILVQLPLPPAFDAAKILNAIDPAKDVDGLHPVNCGRLTSGLPGLAPCTPLGCMLLLRLVRPQLAGLHAVVIGRSNLVGKPVAQLLLQADCTVTVAHSKTLDLPALCRRADILIAATGRAGMVRGDWIKKDAIVIDVGISRIDLGGGKSRLMGDVAYDEAVLRAAAITPVPGGVGPMTIACLLRNTLQAACAQQRVPPPLELAA